MKQNFNQENMVNQQNLYNDAKTKKKTPIGLIIGIIIAIIAVVGICIVIFGSSNNGSSSNTANNSEKIIQIKIKHNKVVALTEKGNMYAIGESDDGWGGKGDQKEVTLLAKNVKTFTNDGDFYIDNDSNLYISGVDIINGGVLKEYTKVGENIKTVSGNALGFLAVSNNNELYAYGKKDFNGVGKYYNTLTKIEGITNVDKIYNAILWSYYTTTNGELYVFNNNEFTKLMDNVIDTNNSTIIKTSDGKIHEIKIKDDIFSTEENEEANGFMFDYFTKDNIVLSIDNDEYPQDVKEMLLIDHYQVGPYYAYINTNNKLALAYYEYENYKFVKVHKKELEYTIDNLEEIYNFIRNIYNK